MVTINPALIALGQPLTFMARTVTQHSRLIPTAGQLIQNPSADEFSTKPFKLKYCLNHSLKREDPGPYFDASKFFKPHFLTHSTLPKWIFLQDLHVVNNKCTVIIRN